MPSRLRIEQTGLGGEKRWLIEPLGVRSGIARDTGVFMHDLPTNLAKKVALLYTCDNDTDLPGVGYRVSQNVFYVEDG